jgi:hypothetical protein
MKIAVFGDSFANKTPPRTAWWQMLRSHGHTVTSYGEAGSSINFSAKLLKEQHQDFDFVIWCITTPGRFSAQIPGSDQMFHSTRVITTDGTIHNRYKNNKISVDPAMVTACQQYLKYFFDPDVENLIGTSLAHYFLNTIPNLMIIPCFQMPLQTEFNLSEIARREIQTVFPRQELYSVYQSYRDIRTCHLTEKNNKILAELVCANLKPGIFTTEYTNFCFENISLDSILEPL